ncbi:MAG: dihydrolipoamide acetyltransferase family protein [Candidatus Sericytochromatia bacterium]
MIEVKLPSIGEGIAEGEIVKWNVKPGDRIQAEAALVEILTDKASIEIPAPSAGVVEKLLYSEGELVPVGQVIAHLRESGEAAAEAIAAVPAQVDAQPVPEKLVPAQNSEAAGPETGLNETGANDNEVMATPSVRRYAREQGVNLGSVKGTGPYGRILVEDVNQAKAAGPEPMPELAPSVPVPGSQAPTTVADERIPLRGIRRKIAEQMVKAKFTAPDFFYADEADLTELVQLRQELAPELKADGIRLTYLPFVVKAVVSGLKKHPTLNASLDDERQEIVLKKQYHIGIATSSPNGLYVPVIRDADQKSILELAVEIERLATAVRDGSVKAEDMRGGTFTITNIGTIGGLVSAPILNYPQVGILAVNKIYQKPMVHQGEIAIRWACTLSICFDHRVVDGADGAYFTNHVIKLLQQPSRLLVS